jgi:hypothetical protein
MKFRLARLLVVAVALFAFATPSSAQFTTGRIDVTVADSTGAILPGVTVDISGPQNRTQVTDANGEARFLNLAPGIYTVAARLSGFNDYVNRDVPVVAGGIVPLRVAMVVAGLATAVEVTAATPTIDPKRTTVSTNVTVTELQEVPSSRDPWVVLQTVPGIIVDRVNVGGAESGQQSNYQAKGAAGGENTWNIDGIPITDMSALGSSPTYYDFDMFQEMQVTTGGADVNSATPGVALNFVLKSGSNTPRGSGRYIFSNEGMQGDNMPDDLRARLGGESKKGNRMDDYKDYGGEIGGPIFRDRLWAWGAIGKTDVVVQTLGGALDATYLTNYSFKGTGQITRDLRANFTYFQGVKEKFGRSVGPSRPFETGWNQGGPTELFKVEGNWVANDSLFLTARWAHVKGGFFLTPEGGLDTNMIFADDAGIGRFSWYEYRTERPQYNTQLEANYFRGRHEIKAGFGYRTADVESMYTVPGNAIITYHDGYPNMIAEVTAWNTYTGVAADYTSAFLADTISFNRLTLNLGVRYDRQASSVVPFTQLGNPIIPSLLPDKTGIAADDAIVWTSLSPRLGLSYALTENRGTILRASYSTFASQMNAGEASFFSSAGSFRGVYFYDVVDLNGNQTVDAAEIAGRTCSVELRAAGVCNWYGFAITDPGQVGTPNHNISDYGTPTTHEAIIGVDHELMANFGVSGNVTWRRFGNSNWRHIEGLDGRGYQQLGTFTGSYPETGSFSVPFFGVTAIPPSTSRTHYNTREGYHQRFLGFELAATKRLSNRWMARLGFSANDHREYFDGPEARQNPTPSPGAPNKDGGLVMRQTGGSGKSGIYMLLPQYQFIATGLYQARWGINLAANWTARQGYATPYFQDRVPTGNPLGNLQTLLLVDDVGDRRLPFMSSLDVRLGKEFTFGMGTYRPRLNLDLDMFNVMNANTVLGRQYNMRFGPPVSNQVMEIMNPRILRVGLRVNF